jgi:hypothetical protein
MAAEDVARDAAAMDAGLAAETRDADRSRVRVLIRDKLSGIDVPFDIRVFLGTVWADHLPPPRGRRNVSELMLPR